MVYISDWIGIPFNPRLGSLKWHLLACQRATLRPGTSWKAGRFAGDFFFWRGGEDHLKQGKM